MSHPVSLSSFTASLTDQGLSERTGMVVVEGGTFLLGSDDSGDHADGEGPVRAIDVSAFAIDARAVTNQRFSDFVMATGYRTQAEDYGWSFVFGGLASAPTVEAATGAAAIAPWWLAVEGADWRHPEGPDSDISDRSDHPAVHVTWHDAMAYCRWSGTRLPTEAEWESAARGGLVQKVYPWGDELVPGGMWRCNIWQGDFPLLNTTEDGYFGTAPVGSYLPNGYGLHEVTGNVWEWCADWFSRNFHHDGPTSDPVGPATGEARVLRGGSYVCHESYCNRYRVAARNSSTPESSTGNVGFRCARSV